LLSLAQTYRSADHQGQERPFYTMQLLQSVPG